MRNADVREVPLVVGDAKDPPYDSGHSLKPVKNGHPSL